ncbi:MAG: hypothetical protein J6M54_00815, partial [Prevotella sp.]|nr:hypothetical protein [Prevotella sp.]
QKGDTGDVASVNGQTGVVQLNDEHIPSTVDGKGNVEAVLSYHSQQIANLGATFWQVVVEDNMFVMYWYGVEAESPISVALEGANYVAYIES